MSLSELRAGALAALLTAAATSWPSFAESSGAVAASEALETEVEAALRAGALVHEVRNFGWLKPGCEISGYPILERSVALDSSGAVCRFVQKQVVSHGSVDSIRSYFDESGILRLVDHELGSTIDRVFLDQAGNIVQGVVSHDAGATWTPAEFDHSEYFMSPSTGEAAKLIFSRQEPEC